MSVYGNYLTEGFFDKKDEERKEIMKNILSFFKQVVLSEGIVDASLTTSSIGGTNSKFLKKQSDVFHITVDSKANIAASFNGGSDRYMFNKTVSEVFKVIASKNSELKNKLKMN